MPQGIVMISRQQMIPASMYANQSQKPLKTNQMMLSKVRTCQGLHRLRIAAIGRFPGLTLARCGLGSKGVVCAPIKEDEPDLVDAGVGSPHGLQCDARRIVDRPAIDTG